MRPQAMPFQLIPRQCSVASGRVSGWAALGTRAQVPPPVELLLEPFLNSADVGVVADGAGGERLQWRGDSRWLEVTVGVLGPWGALRALSPSVTLREHGAVLSLEEKFQVPHLCPSCVPCLRVNCGLVDADDTSKFQAVGDTLFRPAVPMGVRFARLVFREHAI
jgi:hypothetical protein